jgi:hypothetical protein
VAKHSISPAFVASNLNDKISFQQEDKLKKQRLQEARIQTKQQHFAKEANMISELTVREENKAQSKIMGMASRAADAMV